jgi:hypothetical protein
VLPRRPIRYRDGGRGFIRWCEDFVRVPIYPEGSDIPEWFDVKNLPSKKHPHTGRSYKDLWEAQKKIVLQALDMKKGRFKYRLIVFCWPRGEGKSLLACLIQLWKFFNWPKQQIMLGANSKDQVKFVHYDIMRDVIYNSPRLLRIVGKKNIQEKEIRFKSKDGQVISLLRCISSFSGIVSNISGYTFSEIFDMKNPRFFVQLDGSIRAMPNALGVIDSTVSSKLHVLYNLYDGARSGKLKEVYFSYRYSQDGDQQDFWNPNTTQTQLNDYRVKFPFGEFERYFGNLWSAGHKRIFSEAMVEAWEYIGADGKVGNHGEIIQLIEESNKKSKQIAEFVESQNVGAVLEQMGNMDNIYDRLTPISSLYSLNSEFGTPRRASLQELNSLGNYFKTGWSIGVGIDRADPMKSRSSARSMFICVAKGLPGSLTNPFMYLATDSSNIPYYLYILLHIANVESSSLEDLKSEIALCNEEYDGIDMVCGERWGMWDLATWCEEQSIATDIIFPTYDRQRDAFAEVFLAVKQGRFKSAPIRVPGWKDVNILKEEALMFDHDADKRWFGSMEKQEKFGVQDDSIFALGWGMYGIRAMGVAEFRERIPKRHFGVMMQNRELEGRYA